MISNENIKKTGNFRLQVINAATGQIIENYEDLNLVVTTGRINTVKLLGGDASGKRISKIAFGTNGNNPDLTDTGLTGSFSKLISGVTYPESNSVMFSWSLEAGEANGMTIRELGLLNDDGVLCARKVRADIVKTSSVRLVGTWKLTIN
jgi:hypothetical protein